jgi:predicted deacetylase
MRYLRLSLFAFLFLLFALPARAQEDTLVFVIRADDIMNRSPHFGRTITHFEDSVSARGGRITWGVMPHRLIEPANADGVLRDELIASAARGHEISQHGYIHICRRCNETNHEMWCAEHQESFTYQEQEALVRDGMDILEEHLGITPRSFIPPGHYMDRTTKEVLVDNGFDVLSTTLSNRAFVYPGLYNLGLPIEYTWALQPGQYQDALHRALREIRAADGFFNLMLHDPFTRPGYEDGIVTRWTAELLDSLNAEYGSRIRYMTLTEAADHFRGIVVSTEPERRLAGTPDLRIYPRPLSGRAHVEFESESQRPATLAVYDLLGRRVDVLTIGPGAGGRIEWQPDHLPAGTYVLRLVQGSHVVFRTVQVVR